MFKRIWIALGVAAALAVAAAAWAPQASAREGGDGDGDRPHWEHWLVPGVLEAEGEGIAAAGGKLNIRICAEEGILLTKGEGSLPDGSYDEVVEWLGLHVYFGFHGCAELEGRWTAALVVGQGLTLRAEGVGIAFLKGEGTWAKAGGDSGDWSEEGEIIRIGSKLWEKTPVPDDDPTEEPDEDPEPTKTPYDSCASSEDDC
jgi:hypothetical protein